MDNTYSGVRGKRLTQALKDEFSEKALAMNIKGHPVTYIANELNVNWKTANGLLQYALSKRDINEDEERQRSLAHHKEIIRWCWEQLGSEQLKKHAQNRPAYIARIQASIAEIDKLNGIATAPRQDVNVNYRDYTTGSELEELFTELDEYLASEDAASSEARSEESLDT